MSVHDSVELSNCKKNTSLSLLVGTTVPYTPAKFKVVTAIGKGDAFTKHTLLSFDITIGVNVTQDVAQCPFHHVYSLTFRLL